MFLRSYAGLARSYVSWLPINSVSLYQLLDGAVEWENLMTYQLPKGVLNLTLFLSFIRLRFSECQTMIKNVFYNYNLIKLLLNRPLLRFLTN